MYWLAFLSGVAVGVCALFSITRAAYEHEIPKRVALHIAKAISEGNLAYDGAWKRAYEAHQATAVDNPSRNKASIGFHS